MICFYESDQAPVVSKGEDINSNNFYNKVFVYY